MPVPVAAARGRSTGPAGPVSAGPNQASTAVNSGAGSLWTSLTNITAEDGATVNCNAAGNTRQLRCTGYGFAIPGGATIVGVKAEVKIGTSAADISDITAQLLVGGALAGSNQAAAATMPTSAAYVTYGGESDLMGATPTPADVNASNFGFAFQCTGVATVQVDNLRITVYYTP